MAGARVTLRLCLSKDWTVQRFLYSSAAGVTSHTRSPSVHNKRLGRHHCLSHLAGAAGDKCRNSTRLQHCKGIHGKTAKSRSSWHALNGKGNIILMGLPGSGKTTTGRLIAESLDKTVIDVDDHLLTPFWGMSVADKLRQIGDYRFLEEEGRALITLEADDSIISLSGSNPLHEDSMARVAETGLVIYLDVATQTILSRQKSMKVDRIIGMGEGATLEEVLESRRNIYETWHDLRVLVHSHDTPRDVADRVLAALSRFTDDVGHVSTRDVTGQESRSTFLEAVLQGLAPDGGLFVKPSHRPKFSLEDLETLVPLNIRERSLRILEAWIHPLDICPQELRHFLSLSYTRGLFDHPQMCPTVPLATNVYTQELFHGPTASFKDWALQLMPRFFSKAANHLRPGEKFLILAATSGDTGSATLDGFSRHAGSARVGAFVLYPSHNISEIQKQQTITMEGKNIKVIGVDADFDFCQQTVKRIFRDNSLQNALGNCHLSAANSINWGRLLPQILYHVTAYLDLVKCGHVTMGAPVDYCIPTGNFGNILSAFYAKEMGVPIRRLVCASNCNNILTEFLTTGKYRPASYTLQRTISPSIDIITSSNLERMLYHALEDPGLVRQFYKDVETMGEAEISNSVLQTLRKTFVTGFATEQDTLNTLTKVYKDTGYLLDPHTAVGYHVATCSGPPDVPTVIAGTAHFAKFVDNILPALRDNSGDPHRMTVEQLLTSASSLTDQPKMHSLLASAASKPVKHNQTVPAEYGPICDSVLSFARSI
ncbi:threonine synthase-like 1 [Plakobranchus ocellatus]|uniref:Threonine synthase-like 1 n=1 Tax=Plakobranchus ocellatus TaxID=259542 RepID=A0AAV4DI59_9GAST|nr:threonine synthase-like 1 [Plakobranchus ocellatus]